MPISIKWGRPTQAERDAQEIQCVIVGGGPSHQAEILVYIDGLEPGKTYEIEVELKEKTPGGPGGTTKEELEVEDLSPVPVPELPPADPRD